MTSILSTGIPVEEVGLLNLYQLKRLWYATQNPATVPYESHLNCLLLSALGIDIQTGLKYLYSQQPSFEQFEFWVQDNATLLSDEVVQRFNQSISKGVLPQSTRDKLKSIDEYPDVLDESQLAHWHEFGYVIVKNAVDAKGCKDAEQAIWQHIEASPDNPDSWYGKSDQQIMIQLFQSPAFERNRQGIKIHKAFSQLWGTSDIWSSFDRCSLNPPEKPGYLFRGPDLHWDMDLTKPETFATQGILYLTDTLPEQGALTLVPGFQHKLKSWLGTLESGVDPQSADLKALGAVPIAAEAGDLIIWHHRLPHGSSPNHSTQPRIAQYINYSPLHIENWNGWGDILTSNE